jgi:hypothetical protein
VLETSFQPLTVTVQRPASGTDLTTASVSGSTVKRVSSATPPTSDHVAIEIVDPASVTGDTYAITYGTGVPPTWNLVDVTKGTTPQQSDGSEPQTPSYAPVDGMIVKLRERQATTPPLNDGDPHPVPQDESLRASARVSGRSRTASATPSTSSRVSIRPSSRTC